ncbi:MAG: hypothetical protein J6S49_07195 [Erysipelotrichaceae bacterium]|nr:hypothetical protein [Erysipelotrichaceae bacterium]
MKLKIGPVEIEQEAMKDDVLFNEFKESPKLVGKYLEEKSKYFDLALKNTIDGKTMKMIRDFALGLVGGVFFLGWSFYVFFESKDLFEWNGMTLGTALAGLMTALLVLFICFLPVILVGGFMKVASYFSTKKKKNAKKED